MVGGGGRGLQSTNVQYSVRVAFAATVAPCAASVATAALATTTVATALAAALAASAACSTACATAFAAAASHTSPPTVCVRRQHNAAAVASRLRQRVQLRARWRLR